MFISAPRSPPFGVWTLKQNVLQFPVAGLPPIVTAFLKYFQISFAETEFESETTRDFGFY